MERKEVIMEMVNRLSEAVISEFMLDEKGKRHNSDKSKRGSKNSKKEKHHNNDNKKVSKDSKKGSDKMATRRARVIKWLKDPSVNCAEIMRKLWKPSKREEDAARSYFYKCRDGELNDSGVPYSFSDKDINRLYSIKNNTI